MYAAASFGVWRMCGAGAGESGCSAGTHRGSGPSSAAGGRQARSSTNPPARGGPALVAGGLLRAGHGRSMRRNRPVLKPAGRVVVVLGDATVGGRKVRTTQNCINTFAQLGFKLLHNVDQLIYGLYNVIQPGAILVFGRRKRNGISGNGDKRFVRAGSIRRREQSGKFKFPLRIPRLDSPFIHSRIIRVLLDANPLTAVDFRGLGGAAAA